VVLVPNFTAGQKGRSKGITEKMAL